MTKGARKELLLMLKKVINCSIIRASDKKLMKDSVSS